MLKELSSFPSYENYQSEPYFSLWSALCHQGDVYTASYAALPHIIALLEHFDLFLLPASIEISRAKGAGPEMPEDLEGPYFAALKKIPSLIPLVSALNWDNSFSRSVLAALAVSKGQVELAETVLELSEDVLEEFKEWQENR